MGRSSVCVAVNGHPWGRSGQRTWRRPRTAGELPERRPGIVCGGLWRHIRVRPGCVDRLQREVGRLLELCRAPPMAHTLPPLRRDSREVILHVLNVRQPTQPSLARLACASRLGIAFRAVLTLVVIKCLSPNLVNTPRIVDHPSAVEVRKFRIPPFSLLVCLVLPLHQAL
eukprot:3051292-Prymnesium_polylepis.1